MFYYIGIDVGKFSHSICILDDSRTKKIFQINNDKEGFEVLRKKLPNLDNILIGMEATGHYFLNIYDFLLKLNINVEQIALLNPLQVKAFRNTNLRGAKSDNVDAERIAELLRFGDYNRCNVSTSSIADLRELTRLRADIVSNTSDVKRKIISLLDRMFPEFNEVFKNQFTFTAVSLLNDYPTPEDLCELSLEKLTSVIKGLSKRGLDKDKILRLYEGARNSIGISFGKEAFKIELNILLERLKVGKKQTDFIEERIDELVKNFDLNIFTIPGVGNTTGAVILSEIGDISKFSSSQKLIAFAGLDPKLKESGKYQGKTPISKRGSKYLRNALWSSAMVACRHNEKFKEDYKKRRDRGKTHRYAVTAAANKLTKIVYHILKNNVPFDSKLV